MLKGKPSSFSVIYKDPSVNGNPTLTTYTNGVELDISFNNDLPNGIYKYTFDIILASTAQSVKVFLYGECGGSGYKATTTYEHWDGTAHGTTKQNNVADGYFHRMYGRHVHVTAHFRNFGKKVINYGKSYSMNDAGAYNKFVLQKIVANSDEPKVLGLDMTWLFENETEKIYKNYLTKQLDETNDHIADRLIKQLSELVTSLELVDDGESLERDLENNELFKRDVKNILCYITPYIPFVG